MKYHIFLWAILAITMAACQHSHDHESHEDEEVKLRIIAYSNEFELFAEADPFVAGESSNILAHFSHLPSFRALEDGSITLKMIVNGNEITQTLQQPTRKGIYSFDITPEITGEGQLVFEITTQAGKFNLNYENIRVFKSSDEASKDAESEVISHTNTTVFTKEQSWKIDFTSGFPKRLPFGQVIKTTAHVESSPTEEVMVVAKTNGVIQLTATHLMEGIDVSAGQILCSISGKGLADHSMQVRYTEAKSNFDKAKADYDRIKELSKDKIVSEKELQQARNEYEKTKAAFDNLSGNFSESGQQVKSPISGFVKQLFVKNGIYVEAGQPILSVSNNNTLILNAEVRQKYAPVLGYIKTAVIRNSYDNQTYTLEELDGSIVSYSKAANDQNYLLSVKLRITNKSNFIQGSFVEVYLKTVPDEMAITVENEAFLEEQGIYFVYVQVTPELFEKREVKTGATDGLRTEILHGLNTDERIVIKGAVQLRLAQATGGLDAHSGHVH